MFAYYILKIFTCSIIILIITLIPENCIEISIIKMR